MDFDTYALLKSADTISLDKESINFVRDKFYVEQAEYKLKQCNNSNGSDNEKAVMLVKEIFNKTDPHVKKDILRFNQKIEDLEKKI